MFVRNKLRVKSEAGANGLTCQPVGGSIVCALAEALLSPFHWLEIVWNVV